MLDYITKSESRSDNDYGGIKLLSGDQKCAVLMMIPGEKEASKILLYLSPNEIKKLGLSMESVKDIDRQIINLVLDEFLLNVRKHLNLEVKYSDYIHKVFSKALGSKNAQDVLSNIKSSNVNHEAEILEEMDAKSIAETLKSEHAQIIGLVISCLPPQLASDVLKYYSKDKQADIMYRVATMDKVSEDALSHLERILNKQVISSASVMNLEQSGLKSAAKIMNHVKPEMEKTIMSSLLKRDSKTMESIREKMYTFDNFILSDKNSLENLLRNIDIDDLSISLKCANDDIRSKFFNCMSKSAAKNILNDIKEMGPVRLSEIQSAQKRILTVAKQLSDNGSVFFAANRNKETYA